MGHVPTSISVLEGFVDRQLDINGLCITILIKYLLVVQWSLHYYSYVKYLGCNFSQVECLNL